MKKMLQSSRLFIMLALASILLTACASDKQAKSLDLTLSQYEKIIRWSQWDAAVDFLAADYLQQHPVSRLDLDRLRLFRVTQYIVRATIPAADGLGVTQVVEIRLFNRNRAVERNIIDHQEWRYHETRGRWFLHSGLPDVTRAR